MHTDFLTRHEAHLQAIAKAARATLRTGPREYSTTVVLERPGHTGLSVNVPYNVRPCTRLSFGPCYVHPDREGYPLNYSSLYNSSVTCALDRPAAAIAADLERRAWPLARDYAAKQHVLCQAAAQQKFLTETRHAELAAVLGVPVDKLQTFQNGAVGISAFRFDHHTYNDHFTVTLEVPEWSAVLMLAKFAPQS